MKTSVVVITANLGGLDKPVPFVEQSFVYDHYHFDEQTFPLRKCSMTPRLQARIPKMFGWQMATVYIYYIWLDCSYSMQHPDTIKWLLQQLGDKDVAVFLHDKRKTINEEADFLRYKLGRRSAYLTPRYKYELLEEQMQVINEDKTYTDDRLYVSSCLVYRNNDRVREMMVNWWYHTSRFHSIDQLSLPYVLRKSSCSYQEIPDDITNFPYLTHTRYQNKKYVNK